MVYISGDSIVGSFDGGIRPIDAIVYLNYQFPFDYLKGKQLTRQSMKFRCRESKARGRCPLEQISAAQWHKSYSQTVQKSQFIHKTCLLKQVYPYTCENLYHI